MSDYRHVEDCGCGQCLREKIRELTRHRNHLADMAREQEARVEELERVNEDLAKERSAAVDAAQHWKWKAEQLERNDS